MRNKLLLIIFCYFPMNGMPVVDAELPGLLGNRFFGFCVGKIVADKLGFNLFCKSIKGFPYTYLFAQNVPSNIYKTETIETQHDIDIEKITSDHTLRNIRLRGYFQRYKYLKPYTQVIRKVWLQVDPSLTYTQDPQDIVIHVRANHPTCFVPFEYYKKALESTTYKRMFICTDEPNHPFLANFKPYNPIMHSVRSLSTLMNAGMSWDAISELNLDEFLFIRSFNKIITSQSTFAWWAAFLSDAEEIYAPYSNNEFYQVYGKVEEERYHYIETVIGCP